ncbi:MAG: hypothetical protein COY66_02745 [Candidatus Kerfeldbacteria bacterium CG_4_10_14_0_8_um_filter_42_10]|uniref:Uncharacterized protein n=1 Tax=Candidatus Kerfeldbacteria bacterium CG_4_10_14_0_8_um_filter_42_10 TaxID=2014248 RepID=A0A2M7RK35_9BACT|nr:MAG: hypothetical protein COY66_02745 [Candidatus Kerfeldbacteria bacterium CG_4_10_14_0_8_um_filter_42_10]
MISDGENINSTREALKAKRHLNQVRLRREDNEKNGPMLSDDLSPEEQPGAAQLMSKFRNRLNRRERPSNRTISSATGANIPERLGETLPFPSKTTEKSEEVSPKSEDATSQQLNDVRNAAREQNASRTKGQQEKALKQAASKAQWTIRRHKARIPLLLAVLAVALLKDIIDIMGELLSVGTWSWLDWMLDISLGISAYLLGIEKNSKDRMVGWGFVLIEMIPYAGLLPAWTIRVTKAMRQSWEKIQTNQKSLDSIQKKTQSLPR